VPAIDGDALEPGGERSRLVEAVEAPNAFSIASCAAPLTSERFAVTA
jgi:hypothetical protein